MVENKQFQGVLRKSDVIAGRGDLSPFLVHLTRTGKVKWWPDIWNVEKDDYPKLNAKISLERILDSKEIIAVSPFGYFQYKVPQQYPGKPLTNPNSKVQRRWLRSVCFTETPIDHVHFQMRTIEGRSLAFQPYGLAFWEQSIRRLGGNPIFYFDTGNQMLVKSLDSMAVSDDCEKYKSLLPLYQPYGPRFDGKSGEVDFRWEREWRVVGDVRFTYSDIAFGICDKKDINHFENLVQNKFPFVDPRDDMTVVKEKLRLHLPEVKL